MNRSSMLTMSAVAAMMAMPTCLLAEIDAKSREVLESVSEFYSSQSTVSGKSQTNIAFAMGDMKQNFDMKSDFAAARPNKMMLDAKSDMMGSLKVVSNGETLWMSLDAPGMKGYVEDEAPESFQGIMDHEEMEMLAQGAESIFMVMNLMSKESLDKFLTEDVDSAQYKGTENVDGVEHHHLTVVVAQDPGMGMDVKIPMEMWFRTGDQPSITKVVPDMSAMLMGQEGTLDVTYAYTDWAFGEKLAEDTFTFAADQAGKKVDSFMDLMGGGGMEQPEALGEGEAAPAFELETLDGGTFTLASLKGDKVVVLDFWATWCGPCRRGLPVIVDVTNKLKDKGVVFYSVNLRETNEQVTDFLGKQEYTMNVLMDRDGKVGDLFGVSGIPHTVIIGKDGKIANVHVGFSPDLETELTEKLNEILEESH